MTIAKINGQEREVTTAYIARDGSYEATAPTMAAAVQMVHAMQQGRVGVAMIEDWQQREEKRKQATPASMVEMTNATTFGAGLAKTTGQRIAEEIVTPVCGGLSIYNSHHSHTCLMSDHEAKNCIANIRIIFAEAIDKAIISDRAAMDDIIAEVKRAARAEEREECAKVADRGVSATERPEGVAYSDACRNTAALIRSRK